MYFAVSPAAERLTGSALAERLRTAAPELDPGSERGRVAALVLAVTRVPFNVDRLAKASGAPRELAAKVARRLFDNGIDPLDVPDPLEEPWKAETFWNVVGVAEGTLLRREEHGWVEWIPVGGGVRTAVPEWGPAARHPAFSGALPELFPGTEWLS